MPSKAHSRRRISCRIHRIDNQTEACGHNHGLRQNHSMTKRRSKKKPRVFPPEQAPVADEFDARAYFLSVPEEPPKPPEPEPEFDAREYLLNGLEGE